MTKCLIEARLFIDGRAIQFEDVSKDGVFKIEYNTFCSTRTFTIRYIFGSKEKTKEKKFNAVSKQKCTHTNIDKNALEKK